MRIVGNPASNQREGAVPGFRFALSKRPRPMKDAPVAQPTDFQSAPQRYFEPVLARNIEALCARREREQARLGLEERVAGAITRFAGSMRFVYLHLALFGSWIAWNTWPHGGHKFDP